MLTMIFLSARISSPSTDVHFSAYFFHYSLKFSQAKWYFQELIAMIPNNKLQNLPWKNPSYIPKYPGKEHEGKFSATM